MEVNGVRSNPSLLIRQGCPFYILALETFLRKLRLKLVRRGAIIMPMYSANADGWFVGWVL